MIRAVIFDMDGVIIDSENMQQVAYCEAFKNQGIIIHPDDYTENMGRKDAFQRIARKYNREVDFDSLFHDKNKKYHELIDNGIEPIGGLITLLNLIKNSALKIGLASASSLMNIHIILNELDIIGFFDVLVGIDLVRNGKPDPELFLLAAEKLNVGSQECVVIEDSPNGIEAAKRSGMRCVAFTGGHKAGKDSLQADIIVDDLRKITISMLVGEK